MPYLFYKYFINGSQSSVAIYSSSFFESPTNFNFLSPFHVLPTFLLDLQKRMQCYPQVNCFLVWIKQSWWISITHWFVSFILKLSNYSRIHCRFHFKCPSPLMGEMIQLLQTHKSLEAFYQMLLKQSLLLDINWVFCYLRCDRFEID